VAWCGVAWDQCGHINEVVHKQDNLGSQVEANQLNGWIHEAIRIGSGIVLVGNNYLFRNISVDAAFQWTLVRKKKMETVCETSMEILPIDP
jgi:hypothetical protein